MATVGKARVATGRRAPRRRTPSAPGRNATAAFVGHLPAFGRRPLHLLPRRPGGKPFRHEDFPLDDKPTKLKAREMLKMVKDINDKYLAALDHRADPSIRVECATCHRGSPQPRMLQSVLQSAYDTGGVDSTNPTPAFAKRQYVSAAIVTAFRTGADAGARTVRESRDRFGDAVVSEQLVNGLGYCLLGRHEDAAALATFRQNTADHPTSANAWDSLGEALMGTGDAKGAKAAYAKSLELDPTNENANQQLEALKHPAKAKPGR